MNTELNSKDSLGDRMKSYELITRMVLPARSWSILRLDGKAFHTWTAGLDKPYSVELIDAMQKSMLSLCEQIPGSICAYQQSDELTVVFQDFSKADTQAWYGGQVQKIVSVAASIMTAEFGKHFPDRKPALFDARVFTVPSRIEAANNLRWRKLDGQRNSISLIASSIFSERELFGKSTEERRDMILNSGYNLENVDPRFMHGQFAHKIEKEITEFTNKKTGEIIKLDKPALRGVWQSTASPDLNAREDGFLLAKVLPLDPV